MARTFQKISDRWAGSTLRNKIAFFLSSVLLVIFVSVLLDLWIVRLSILDVNDIINDNLRANDLVTTMTSEFALFESYMKGADDETAKATLDEAIVQTKLAVEALPYAYSEIGAQRYSKTWSINNMYSVYCDYRDEILKRDRERENFITDLYRVYDLQAYLSQYSKELMNMTIQDGTDMYRTALPKIISVPIVVAIVVALLLIAIFNVSMAMNKTIVDPVVALAEASRKIGQRDFSIPDVRVNNRDEIGELTKTFNEMKYATGQYIVALKNSQETMELLHQEELERLEAERQLENMRFDMLKNQVNPHFLFNTLNVISGMAQLEDAQTTEKMIRSLSDLFRYNLKTQDSEVVLSQEIKVVSDYMYLQKMRFGERIRYNLDCQVDETSVLIPAFTLQPLVENSIIHGISPKESGGTIGIIITAQDTHLCIEISDDGLGMSQETLNTLLEDLDAISVDDGKYHGIGLGNTVKRIRGMYSDGDVIIQSQEGKGTIIHLRLPLMEIGTYQGNDNANNVSEGATNV